MALLEWSEDLSVGFDEIDNDHKKLIDLLNDVDAAVVAGHAPHVVGGFLEELISYTIWHFRHEEELMEAHGDPDILMHKAQHVELTEAAEDMHQRFLDGDADVAETLLPFLKDWLTSHILETDMKTGAFLASRAA